MQAQLVHGVLAVQVTRAGNVDPKHGKLYVKVKVGARRILKSHVVATSKADGAAFFQDVDCAACVADCVSYVSIQLAAADSGRMIGIALIPAGSLTEGNPVQGQVRGFATYGDAENAVAGPNNASALPAKVKLLDKMKAITVSAAKGAPTCEIEVYVKLFRLKDLIEFPAVPYAPFPLRSGCMVSLFQDAHEMSYLQAPLRRRALWEELYASLHAAEHLILIAGWSVWHDLRLLRERPWNGQSLTLGELLHERAERGCTVRVLVWDDPSSLDGREVQGMMGNHDELLVRYFEEKNSKVQVLKQARIPAVDPACHETHSCFTGHVQEKARKSILEKLASSMFTHHQKIVVCDAPLPGALSRDPSANLMPRRRLKAFVGGLDLCDGRWDTPEHFLFKHLNTYWKDDFHNFNFPRIEPEYGPREPWHDVHSLIEGHAAVDVLRIFEARWNLVCDYNAVRMGPERTSAYRTPVYDADTSRPGAFIPAAEEAAYIERVDPNAWSVQMVRSIDERSSYFPREHAVTFMKKGRGLDTSVLSAYVHYIRRAKRFVYIENQYFMGSSYAWALTLDAKEGTAKRKAYANLAPNPIPMEIALRICRAIREREPFCAFIIIPLWPEGVPESMPVQEILFWQYQTVEMMYRVIAQELQEVNSDARPEDYLQILTLGNREAVVPSDVATSQSKTSAYWTCVKRRQPIYVHSKLMIVDDAFLIIGSANINERSMAGTRDTEVAACMFQRKHIGSLATGAIHAFRMNLFAEHMGNNLSQQAALRPELPASAREIAALADHCWKFYCADAPPEKDIPAHIMRYPYSVDKDGLLYALGAAGMFPDTSAYVRGKDTFLPDLMTC
ncbi:Phospholipase D alpha 1 [Porphyridium purpureum]|uniref:phospholipase D n=1 Tax=Porphyridium purpureum TaxID=35688 RepID=A0A5J4YHQ1_PORPP|nr:Phospholipase D alpha 1 [Porphyridium purpureum]|eukprot:POR4706..scf243_20